MTVDVGGGVRRRQQRHVVERGHQDPAVQRPQVHEGVELLVDRGRGDGAEGSEHAHTESAGLALRRVAGGHMADLVRQDGAIAGDDPLAVAGVDASLVRAERDDALGEVPVPTAEQPLAGGHQAGSRHQNDGDTSAWADPVVIEGVFEKESRRHQKGDDRDPVEPATRHERLEIEP